MDIGMLWYDDDGKRSLPEKVPFMLRTSPHSRR